MKNLLMSAIIFCGAYAIASEKFSFYFVNEEITKVIEIYSKVSGNKFVVDSTVRGKITILNQSEISVDEAWNQLSEGLAVNGFAAVKNGDVYTIRNARSAQRDNLPVFVDTLPAAKPQRMVTWIVTVRHVSAENIARDLRLLTSSYGEMSVNSDRNQLIFSDWSQNIQRVSEVIKNVDKPVDPAVAKIVAAAKKDRKERVEVQIKKKALGSEESEPEKAKN